MEVVKISEDEWNYLKDDGTYLLDEHVYYCWPFINGIGIVRDAYYTSNCIYLTENFINSEGKKLLKTNAAQCEDFWKNGFGQVEINDTWHYIDKECNFYELELLPIIEDMANNCYKIIPFKEIYNEYPAKRQELIEIISKYTYHDINEYFNI